MNDILVMAFYSPFINFLIIQESKKTKEIFCFFADYKNRIRSVTDVSYFLEKLEHLSKEAYWFEVISEIPNFNNLLNLMDYSNSLDLTKKEIYLIKEIINLQTFEESAKEKAIKQLGKVCEQICIRLIRDNVFENLGISNQSLKSEILNYKTAFRTFESSMIPLFLYDEN